MEVWLSKVITLALTFIMTLTFGLLPIKLISIIRPSNSRNCNKQRAEKILSYLNCFSGGVFLAVTLLHLLPDVRHDFQSVLAALQQTTDFPMAEFVTCLGFFLVMLIENVVIQYQRGWSSSRSSGKNGVNQSGESCAVPISNDEERALISDLSQVEGFGSASVCDSGLSSVYSPIVAQDRHGSNSLYGSIESLNHKEHKLAKPSDVLHSDHSKCNKSDSDCRSRLSYNESWSVDRTGYRRLASDPDDSHDDVQCERYDDVSGHLSSPDETVVRKRDDIVVTDHSTHEHPDTELDLKDRDIDEGHSKHSHSHGMLDSDEQVHSLRSLVLLLALSTHTVFEGMALGLQETTAQVWTLFLAIIVHKIIMSFTAGLRFIESLKDVKRTILYILIFSVTAPIGIAIGLAVTEAGRNGLATDITSAILQGVATGTFVYVTFFEVLLEEMTNNQSIAKVLCVIIGFACITGLSLIDDHGDHGSDKH